MIPPLHTPADVIHNQSGKDLDTFLRLTETKPTKFCVILHKVGGVNTPPPQGRNVGTYYFDVARFDEPEYYNEEVEGGEKEVRQRAGGTSAKTLLFLSGLFGFPGLSAISLDCTRQNNPLYGLLGLFGFQSALNIFTRILCLPPFFVFFTFLKEARICHGLSHTSNNSKKKLVFTGEGSKSSHSREGVLRHLGF